MHVTLDSLELNAWKKRATRRLVYSYTQTNLKQRKEPRLYGVLSLIFCVLFQKKDQSPFALLYAKAKRAEERIYIGTLTFEVAIRNRAGNELCIVTMLTC